MKLDLTEAEKEALVAFLDQGLGDLSMEIADTDNAEFRRDLETRRGHLRDVRGKLNADVPRDELIVE
jgi:hypothetical protein